MRRYARLLSIGTACSCLAAVTRASDLKLDGLTAIQTPLGYTISVDVSGEEGQLAVLLTDLFPGPTVFMGDLIPLALSPFVQVIGGGVIPTGGAPLNLSVVIPSLTILDGLTVYFAAAVVDPGATSGFDFSNGAAALVLNKTTFERIQLAGTQIARYPRFEFSRAFNQGTALAVTVDPTVHPYIAGKTADVYVTAHKDAAGWDADPSLIDVSGDGADTEAFAGPGIADNVVTVDAGTLSGAAGDGIGVPYDVVVDVNRNGTLDGGDFIDGYADEAGLYVVHDLTLPGPYAVTETLYSGGTWLGQNTFYPSNIAALGVRPLIVVSHGNGHNYQWYDHLGTHLASYGFVVMSHQNNTVPGVEAASTTTLTNTDYLLGNLALIDGGILNGHVDVHNIGWIGHSRGGEGVARAFDRLLDGAFVPANYDASDIRFISSIAPTDFLGVANSTPHDVDYHLWVGGSDADVTGCADSDIAQSYHILDRAAQQRQSISLHGAGHGDFHNGGGSSVATGPCQIGRVATHTIMRGYALPLFKHHLEGNIPATDFLWRQWESFRPISAPVGACIVVQLQYREGAASGKFVIDDFQTNVGLDVASTGAAVTFDVFDANEGRMDDPTSNFTANADAWNGFTQASASDVGRGLVFSWDSAQSREIAFDVPPQAWDMTGWEYVSFRAAQAPRHSLTIAQNTDAIFVLELADGSGSTSSVSVSAWQGGVEEPYQRTSCGTGTGWAAEFETIRVRLTDLQHEGSGLDLTDVRTIRFRFGPSFGAPQGRVAIDDVELAIE